MGFNLESIRPDADKELDGVKIELFNDLFVTLRPCPNDEYDNYIQTHTKGINFNRKQKLTKTQISRMEPVVQRAVAKFVVVDWEGMTETVKDDEGTETEVDVPFSIEKCIEYFQKSPKFYSAVFEEAREDSWFLQDQLDEQAGNS